MSYQDKPLSLEEYRNYKRLFEKCFRIPITEAVEIQSVDYDYDFWFGSSYERDIDEIDDTEYNE